MLRIIRNYLLRIYSYCYLIGQGFTFCKRIGFDAFVNDDFWGEKQCRSRIGPNPFLQRATGDSACRDVASSSALTTT